MLSLFSGAEAQGHRVQPKGLTGSCANLHSHSSAQGWQVFHICADLQESHLDFLRFFFKGFKHYVDLLGGCLIVVFFYIYQMFRQRKSLLVGKGPVGPSVGRRTNSARVGRGGGTRFCPSVFHCPIRPNMPHSANLNSE